MSIDTVSVEKAKLSFDNTEVAFKAKSDNLLKQDYLLFASMNYNGLVKFGTSFINFAIKVRLPFVKSIVKATLFKHFCGGESIADSQNTIKELAKSNVGTILDYSVEGEAEESSFDATLEETLRTINLAKGNPDIPFCVFKPTGFGSGDLMEKIQLKQDLTEEERDAFQRIRSRFDRACRAAYENNVKVFIDAEDSWYQDPIDMLVYEMMEKYNKEKAIVYNTFQMYRKYMLDRMTKAHQDAKEKGYQFGAKLVRGAYMEKERARAAANGYEDPIQPTKDATDKQFDDGVRYCIDNNDTIAIACCSHNENSNRLLADLIVDRNLDPNDDRYFFAQLFGMSDNITFNLADTGFNIGKYVPYGPLEKTLPYLFRRAEENTSIAGQSSRELTLIQKELDRRKKSR
ncbi:proline dehydrogenase family protein [Aureibacter tunicatorum]|uniref:Proline dehydrogenase n=1 Tax=Aureibacter tunicatorum TaxID=866807 RepID=A0AAE3XN45_9BACT|nr:proline dehydrogenase family protein [Aureibacter tunicatorum]MDR6239555.1 proline dehydrogenase [Aureibacter tunicatorum]BDD04032.1 proline dehydrogenase [Aureibacter tunicatorum]